jgi:hypothetical protein
LDTTPTWNSSMTFHGPDTMSGDREMVVRGDNTMYFNMQRGQKVVL